MKKSILIASLWLMVIGFVQINFNQLHAQSGYALKMSGEVGNSNVSISGLPLTALPYTMEMWFKPEGNQASYTGLLVNPTVNNGITYVGWQGDEKLRLNATGGEQYAQPTVTGYIAPDEWHHAVAIVTDTSRTLIVDGVAYTEKATFSAADFSASETFIGYYGVSDRVFKGLVDEVRIWNVARTEQEINDNKSVELTGTETGLVAYYNFNDETANDLTTNAVNGVVTGGSFIDLDAPVLNISTTEVKVETKGYGFPVSLSTENISALHIEASVGFAVSTTDFSETELQAGEVDFRIFAAGMPGETGTIILSGDGENLDTINLTTVEYADRYLIKQLESGLFLGENTGNPAQPALADSTAFASQSFIMQPVNDGVDDSLFYLIQDSTYTYLSKKATSGWSTVYGALEDGSWKIVLGDDGYYTIFNTVKGYLATDGTTVNSSFYADKGLSTKAQFIFSKILSTDASLASLTVDVGTLDPVFNAETMSYSVLVPVGVTSVSVDALANDATATVSGTGYIELTQASTNVDVVVTAENGDQKTYTINFTVEGKHTNAALKLAGVDGNSSNVKLEGLPLSTLPFTIEMWIQSNENQVANSGIIFNRPGNFGFQYTSGWQSTAQSIRFMASGGDTYGSPTVTPDVSLNEWHHLAVVLTDSTRTVIYDGVEKTEKSTFSPIDWSTGITYLGWDSDVAERAFNGSIDEVRVWDTIRTYNELLYNKFELLDGTEEGLIAYYNFDDQEDVTIAKDVTGTLNGVITGGSYVESDFMDLKYQMPELELSEVNTIYLEDGLKGYELSFTTSNSLLDYTVSVPTGFSATPAILSTEDFVGGTASVIIAATSAAVGDSGSVVISYNNSSEDIAIDSIGVELVEPYQRYFIKQVSSGLVLGSRDTDASIPVLKGQSFADMSQRFILRPVNEGTDDGLFYLVQDVTYNYFNKQSSSGWNTILGALEQGIWKLEESANGNTILSNSALPDKCLSSDATTVDSRVYADKAKDHANAEFTLEEVKFIPETGVDYYFIQNASRLALGEDAADARVRLQEPELNSAAQQVQFIETDVEGEYLIKNSASGYLCYFESWRMGFVADTTGIVSTCTFEVVTNLTGEGFYLHSIDKSATQYVGTDNTTVGSGVFPDKGMNEKGIWNILKSEDIKFTPIVTISESVRIDVEKGLKPYPVTISAVNVADTLVLALPDGFSAETVEILPSSFKDGADFTIFIDAESATVGDQGVIEFALKQEGGLNTVVTVPATVVEPYTRYFIKQYESGLVMGSNTNDEFVPVLSEVEKDNDSLMFMFKPVNLGVDDSLYYIVQDVDYRYFSWSNVNNWDTKLGELERGQWKIVADTGYVSIMNVENNKYVATDGVTVGSRFYADKSLEGNTKALFELLDASLSDDASLTSLAVSIGTMSPAFTPETMDYEVLLPAGSTSVDILAEATDNGAVVEGAGTINITADTTIVEVVITAETGDKLTYTLTITVEGTSVSSLENNEFKVYPTVSDKYFTMQAQKGSMVKIYNVSGELVKQIHVQNELTKFELQRTGYYIVKLKDKVVRVTRIN